MNPTIVSSRYETYMTAHRAAARVKSGATRGKASSVIALAFSAALLAGTPLYAQRAAPDSSRAAAESLAIRLRRAEEAIATLQQQVNEQASQAVTTRSRTKLEFNGRVVVHAVRNDAEVNNADDPQFVTSAASVGTSRYVMTARQSTFGAVLTTSDVLGGQFVGDVDVDFYGGQLSNTGGRTFPLVRMRTARGMVRWTNGELLIGQETPLIAGLNPVSPAAVGTPLFATAGNLWLWLPQIRGTVETSGSVRLGLQGAVLANITGDGVGNFDTSADPSEQTGRPALEGRVRARWGEAELAGELGCGGHLGWIQVAATGSTETYAAACDARIPFTASVELRGEAFVGRGLRGLGGGAIGQSLNRNQAPLDARGGWAQVNVNATPEFKFGAGCGIDAPTEADVANAGRLRNRACAGYGIVRPSGPLFFGFEARHISTRYAAGSLGNLHLSLASGFEF